MTIYVLDSSALLRYVDDEAGAERVEEILRECASWRSKICISAVQWGEIAARLRTRLGAPGQARILSSLLPSEVEIVPANGDRAVRAAGLRVDRGISYADAFAVELALDSPDHVLVTADFGFKPVEDLIKIEFLHAK